MARFLEMFGFGGGGRTEAERQKEVFQLLGKLRRNIDVLRPYLELETEELTNDEGKGNKSKSANLVVEVLRQRQLASDFTQPDFLSPPESQQESDEFKRLQVFVRQFLEDIKDATEEAQKTEEGPVPQRWDILLSKVKRHPETNDDNKIKSYCTYIAKLAAEVDDLQGAVESKPMEIDLRNEDQREKLDTLFDAFKNSDGQNMVFKKQGEYTIRPPLEAALGDQYDALPDEIKVKVEEKLEMEAGAEGFDWVTFRHATGELLVTQLSDGTVESVEIVESGQKIVKNPDGEEYALSDDAEFQRKYKPVEGKENIYEAIGQVVAVSNPYGRPILFRMSSGQWQKGDADCLILDEYNPDTGERQKDPYVIERKAFEATYRPVAGEAELRQNMLSSIETRNE